MVYVFSSYVFTYDNGAAYMTTRQRHKEIPKAKVAGGHGIPAFRSPKILKLNLARVLLQEQQKTRYEIARRTELHPDTLKNLLQEHPTSITVSALEQI